MAKKTVSKKVSAKKTVPVKYHRITQVNNYVKDIVKACNLAGYNPLVVVGETDDMDDRSNIEYYASHKPAHVHIIEHGKSRHPIVTVYIDDEVVLPIKIKLFYDFKSRSMVLVVWFNQSYDCVVAIA